MSDSKIKLSDFLKISLLLIVPLLQNCSTIQIADRIGKDIHLEEPDYKKLQGIYLDSIIVDYPKKTTDTISFAYAPCKVELEPLTPKRLKFTYYINQWFVKV